MHFEADFWADGIPAHTLREVLLPFTFGCFFRLEKGVYGFWLLSNLVNGLLVIKVNVKVQIQVKIGDPDRTGNLLEGSNSVSKVFFKRNFL